MTGIVWRRVEKLAGKILTVCWHEFHTIQFYFLLNNEETKEKETRKK